MTDNEAIGLFKCLADATRLQIIKSLREGPMYVELLSERLERTPSTISFHMKKLEEAGMVRQSKEQYYTMYTLNDSVLTKRLCDIIGESDETKAQREREMLYRDKVLNSFIKYGKLVSIPVQRKKKRIILEKIAESFEPHRLYPEREVNVIIADYFDDFCTIRRDMISEGIMTRDKTGYMLVADSADET